MLTVYGRKTSSNVQTVMWTIGELGLRYERLDYGHNFGGLGTAEYRELNPNSLVPTLKDGDLIIWESAAIDRYLASRYGDGGSFWPSDPRARALVDQWAEWGKTTFQRAFTVPIFWARVRTPAADRDEDALAAALKRFDEVIGILEGPLAHQLYVAGDEFTLADISIGHVLYRYFDIDIPRIAHPLLESYYQRLTDRPAFREHVMVSYGDLRSEGA
jgi:glutathione S-transferase